MVEIEAEEEAGDVADFDDVDCPRWAHQTSASLLGEDVEERSGGFGVESAAEEVGAGVAEVA